MATLLGGKRWLVKTVYVDDYEYEEDVVATDDDYIREEYRNDERYD